MAWGRSRGGEEAGWQCVCIPISMVQALVQTFSMVQTLSEFTSMSVQAAASPADVVSNLTSPVWPLASPCFHTAPQPRGEYNHCSSPFFPSCQIQHGGGGSKGKSKQGWCLPLGSTAAWKQGLWPELKLISWWTQSSHMHYTAKVGVDTSLVCAGSTQGP